MKTSFATSSLAAAVAFLALAVIGSSPSFVSAAEADINIVGAKTTPMMRGTRGVKDSGIDTKIATHDILNRATALVNKNTLAMDNNVFVSRSNIVMAQNDRLAMAKKVEALVASAPQMSTTESESETEADEDYHDAGRRADMSPAAAAVLTKNIMTAVGGKDTDAVTMSKASAVVAAKGDANVRAQRIADLVNAVFDAKAQREQMLQTQGSGRRGGRTTAISIGSKDILRQPTGVVNKNMVLSDSQVAISRSTLAPTQNDNIMLDKHAKVATLVAPASAIDVNADVSTDSDDRDSKN